MKPSANKLSNVPRCSQQKPKQPLQKLKHEVAAMQAKLLTEASDRERDLEQQLVQLEADMNAQIASKSHNA